jgi:penicillin amidase
MGVTADGARFAHVHGAGMRLAVDMSHPDAPVFNLAGGQSGHPLSSHYSDLLPEWAAGTYRTFQNPAEDVLILRPQQKKPATAEESKP